MSSEFTYCPECRQMHYYGHFPVKTETCTPCLCRMAKGNDSGRDCGKPFVGSR